MFRDNQTFSSFSVDDIAAAKAFYGGTLDLNVADDPQGGFRVNLGKGGMLAIYTKPNHEPATFTVLNFVVDDINQAVDALIAAGVTMEHYNIPDIPQNEKGIAADDAGAIAWFKDPAGNVLSVVQMA